MFPLFVGWLDAEFDNNINSRFFLAILAPQLGFFEIDKILMVYYSFGMKK